ncbi:OmpA family protein [Thermocrinis sp.]
MRKIALALSLLGGVVFAQEAKRKPLDPCGSPPEVFSKYLLDKCYEGYFKAIMDAKKAADDALKVANEANRKAGDLERRVGALERTAEDHERRIRALEARRAEAPRPAEAPKPEVGPYKWRLEDIGTVHFDFDRFNIKKSEAKKLDELVNKIKDSGREVLVVGFADKRGSSRYNFNLSTWRAQMVASYLAKQGVDIGKMRIASYGKEVADLLGKNYSDQRAVRIFLIH